MRQFGKKDFIFAGAIALAAFLPFLINLLSTPAGSSYLGHQTNNDDQMVYAAWMRQAMDGHFLFDNRFTPDPQPGLTLHLYFLVLGFLAKIVGLTWAPALARIGFSFLLVLLLGKWFDRLEWSEPWKRVGQIFVTLAGGFGFLIWHDFKGGITKPVPEVLSSFLMGKLPTDVYQPEGFLFPSMLTNGLFMVSLCLIFFVFQAVLDAKVNSKTVIGGAVALGILMNIHSYDVLLVALVLVGLLAATVYQKSLTKEWIVRSCLIVLGVIPAAVWFSHVLANDPVFQARAATETYTANFRGVFFGYLPLIGLGMTGLWIGVKTQKQKAGFAIFGVLLLALLIAAGENKAGYFLSMPVWVVVFALATTSVVLLSSDSPIRNLILSWALIGTIAIYFPALFQRKLSEGLSIPWAILSVDALRGLLANRAAQEKKLVMALATLVVGATSLRWFVEELQLAKMNVSTTTVHPVYLSADELKVVTALNEVRTRRVVISPPGIPAAVFLENSDKPLPDQFGAPIEGDLNPILSGLTGAYTYAGHWSETPNYMKRRGEVQKIFSAKTSLEDRNRLIKQIGVTHIVARKPIKDNPLGYFDFTGFPGAKLISDSDQYLVLELN